MLGRFIIAIGLAAGCTPHTAPRPTAADATRANVALGDLEEGRKLLVGRCAACHKVPLPDEHPAAQWPKLVADMAERSKLDARQQSLIAQYLVTMSTR